MRPALRDNNEREPLMGPLCYSFIQNLNNFKRAHRSYHSSPIAHDTVVVPHRPGPVRSCARQRASSCHSLQLRGDGMKSSLESSQVTVAVKAGWVATEVTWVLHTSLQTYMPKPIKVRRPEPTEELSRAASSPGGRAAHAASRTRRHAVQSERCTTRRVQDMSNGNTLHEASMNRINHVILRHRTGHGASIKRHGWRPDTVSVLH
jgi:hypothetical protein